MLFRTPPPVVLLGFLCVRRRRKEQNVFSKSCSRLTFDLYSGNLWPNYLFINFLIMTYLLLLIYLFIKSYGCYTYNPHLSYSLVFGSCPKGLTQLSFVLTRTIEWPTLGSVGSTSTTSQNASGWRTTLVVESLFQWSTAPAGPWFFVSNAPTLRGWST